MPLASALPASVCLGAPSSFFSLTDLALTYSTLAGYDGFAAAYVTFALDGSLGLTSTGAAVFTGATSGLAGAATLAGCSAAGASAAPAALAAGLAGAFALVVVAALPVLNT